MSDNPYGLHKVTPYLVVPDVRRLIAFTQALFGAKLRGHPHYKDNGGIEHAEVTIGDSTIMMGEAENNGSATLYVYVDDCDAAFEKAQKIGGTVLQEPKDYPHGDRLAGIQDPLGNGWWLAQHVCVNAA